jgi:hypothetical protein
MTDFYIMLNDGRVFKTKGTDRSNAINNAFKENYDSDDDVLYDQPSFMDSITHMESVETIDQKVMYRLIQYSNGVITCKEESMLEPIFQSQFLLTNAEYENFDETE